ncbi:MAG: hypothetical protein IPI59_08980 [Sphingobacteriales bacterium]|jgi:hypothetical protein|nr:hypothetical protein [Sphingobacteriales bacterium]MCC7057638.1 hypothetical protein [Chitinophagales bacterium]MDA0198673.1 hypothetical protein [Bacteroidota bacterium]
MTEQEAKWLRAENAQLRQEVVSLTAKVKLLLEQLSKPVIKKDSHNSSLPPSSDIYRPAKTKSLRLKSDKKAVVSLVMKVRP